MPVYFHAEDVQLPIPLKSGPWKKWLQLVAKGHGYKLGELNYIFCSDSYLLEMNMNYLKHDTLTDIITFDNSETTGPLEGDIYISLERVAENARKFKVTTAEELARVMAHGLLHLCGFRDKAVGEIKEMRKQEALALDIAREIMGGG